MPESRGRPSDRQPRSKEASAERKPVPVSPPRRSLAQATLRFLSRALRVILACAIRPRIAARWCLLSLWKNPWKSLKTTVNIFFRIATLMSVGYLVFDRLYETSATVSSIVSDPKDPFRLPFTITNSSHIFTIRNISWTCRAIRIEGGHKFLGETRLLSGTTNELAPGKGVNFSCNVAGRQNSAINIDNLTIERAVLEIGFTYDADIFGWLWKREPTPTRFTWEPSSTSSQWLKGEFFQ